MHQSSSLPLSWLARYALVLSGIGAVTLLVLAATLDPDDRGFGTHLQLGLAPCSIRMLFGMRCPACGMTTAWALAMDGRLLAALEANTGGVALAATAFIGGPACLVFGLRGRWPAAVTEWRMLVGMLVIVAIILTDWMIRLAGS